MSDKYEIACTFLDLLRQRLPSSWNDAFPWHAPLQPQNPSGIYLNLVDNSSQIISRLRAYLLEHYC